MIKPLSFWLIQNGSGFCCRSHIERMIFRVNMLKKEATRSIFAVRCSEM
jgi:hypothetical protein